MQGFVDINVNEKDLASGQVLVANIRIYTLCVVATADNA
ncbi:MAG: hypothetical protein K0R67_1961 [Paenibacillus sp.]|nr:hypothetical protein [Paenibacillus sp.]